MKRDDFFELKEKNQGKIAGINTYTVVNDSGEVLDEHNLIIRGKSVEPDYIKIYYQTLLMFNNITQLPVNFVCSLSKFVEWSNDGKPLFITINKRVKDEIQADCDVKSAQVERYIKIAKESGLLFRTEYRGVYEVNPFIIAKGKWESIKKLQARFNYMDGEWIIEGVIDDDKEDKKENIELKKEVKSNEIRHYEEQTDIFEMIKQNQQNQQNQQNGGVI